MARNNNGASTNEELATLKRIEELVTVIARTLLSEKLAAVSSDKNQRQVYEGAGQIPVKELAKQTGLSVATISRLWQKWARAGLMIKDGKSYRPIL